MELQQSLVDLERAGVAVFAISYDPVEVLSAFAEKRGITFPMLSDQGSAVIRQLGLLNEHIDQQHAYFGVETQQRHRGIPYPGAFVLDEDGLVADKVFEQQHRTRLSAAALVEAVLHGASTRPSASAAAEGAGIRVTVSLGQDCYRPYQKLLLHLCLKIPDGAHVYADPAPEGQTGLTGALETIDGLEAAALELPPPSTITSFGEQFQGYENDVTGTLWFAINKFHGDVSLQAMVRYQACTDVLCYPPAELRIPLVLRGVDLIQD